jgi:hypothetical protein
MAVIGFGGEKIIGIGRMGKEGTRQEGTRQLGSKVSGEVFISGGVFRRDIVLQVLDGFFLL